MDLPATPAELLEQFGKGPMTAEAISGATLALKKADRAGVGRRDDVHLVSYPAGVAKPANATNQLLFA